MKKTSDYKELNPLKKSADLLFSNMRSFSACSRGVNPLKKITGYKK
jgi:hypothetical protein